ncbi:ABC transporter ATP-binding protein [Streptomyces rhizosphaericus]|uniref:ABC transporter ATP-binding protein n=1 Tax=Streptomyces rhizosphaericus TaxID=114699 RepID=A0A6G4AGL4_9ACTN|nr:ABC transporter ATP-binding protein [Streptomyces rhizosphaericus]NEW71647.1 ABC transporter ATP-binding protein [Streptomyces rhizosphaericus]
MTTTRTADGAPVAPPADQRPATRLPLAGQQEVHHWFWTFVRGNSGRITAMLTLFGLALATGLVGPRLLGHLVESVQRSTTAWRVDMVALVLVAVLAVQALLTRAAQAQTTLLGEKVLAETRESFVRRVMRLPLGTVESVGTGDLLSRATSDVDRLNEGIRLAMPRILMAAVTLTLTVVAMLLTSPLLSLLLLTGLPFAVFSTRWYRPRATRGYEELLKDEAEVLTSTHETVRGAASVEALGLAGRRIAHHGSAMDRVVRHRRRITGLQTVWYPSLDLATMVPMALTLLAGGAAYRDGRVGLAEITAMVLYLQSLNGPLVELLSWTDELQVGNAALRRILGVERLPVERSDTGAVPTGRRIRLRGVRFGYDAGREVLHGIDLDIPPGGRIAVVGASGAGKSTLGKLLAGVHHPSAGVLEIGDVPVSTMSIRTLRREVALVTQENHVFAGSIRDNLTLPERRGPGGGTGPDDDTWGDEELWTALRTVGLEEWARTLPDGLDSPVATGETDVPAVTAQQLALARLLLADPHTLVLDEATALMDPTASRQVERSMAALLAGRSVISIAHRLDSVPDADLIAVMDSGRIVELGSHHKLLQKDGAYARLWRSWSAAGGGAEAGG